MFSTQAIESTSKRIEEIKEALTTLNEIRKKIVPKSKRDAVRARNQQTELTVLAAGSGIASLGAGIKAFKQSNSNKPLLLGLTTLGVAVSLMAAQRTKQTHKNIWVERIKPYKDSIKYIVDLFKFESMPSSLKSLDHMIITLEKMRKSFEKKLSDKQKKLANEMSPSYLFGWSFLLTKGNRQILQNCSQLGLRGTSLHSGV